MTPAQAVANRRSFRIFSLRGLHANCKLLTGWRQKVARFCIDQELQRLGATPETLRQDLRRIWADNLLNLDQDIPF